MPPPKPFGGLVIAVTSRSDDSAVAPSDTESFTSLESLVKTLGGKTSKMVHKNCAFLVATEHAVKMNTQRVRKARKCQLNIVRPAYLVACAQAKAVLPRDEYIYQEPS